MFWFLMFFLDFRCSFWTFNVLFFDFWWSDFRRSDPFPNKLTKTASFGLECYQAVDDVNDKFQGEMLHQFFLLSKKFVDLRKKFKKSNFEILCQQ